MISKKEKTIGEYGVIKMAIMLVVAVGQVMFFKALFRKPKAVEEI